MALYKESTKTRPLLFFESFINNDKLTKYEDMFYNFPANPSQENYREQGYIKYLKDTYVDEPVITITEYFKDNLKKLLQAEINFTKSLLIERKDEIEYFDSKSDIFFKKQLETIQLLKVENESITVCKELILETLNIIENYIKKLGNIGGKAPNLLPKIKTNKPQFDPKVNRRTLKKLYDIALDNKIIDDEIVAEEDFLNILTSNSPESLENKFVFTCDNQVATFFLNQIAVLFYNLTHSEISKSKAFINKGGKILNQNDLDKAKTLYSKKLNNSVFLSIQKDIKKLIN